MQLFTKYVLFLLSFIIVAQANIAPLKSSYDLSSSEYGVRYYDPRTSVWQSPDPILQNIMSQPESYSRLPKKLAVYTYGEQNPVVMKDPDGLDDIYYDQKGYEIERKETTKWYNPSTWGDNKFVQGNKSDQWWPTTENITPDSINGVEDANVAEI